MPQMTNYFSIGDDPSFRALFTEMPCACMVHRMILDESGKCIDFIPIEPNPWFSRALAFDPAPILGKRATEYLPEDEARHWAEVFSPVALEGKTVSLTIYSPRKKQTYRVTAISPERGFFLTMYAVAGKAHDNEHETKDAPWTEGRIASHDIVEMMFRTMPCAAALHRIDCDEAGKPVDYTVVDVNGPFCAYLETTSEAIIGKNASARLNREEFSHWLNILAPIALGLKPATAIPIHFGKRASYEGVAISLQPGYVTVLFTN